MSVLFHEHVQMQRISRFAWLLELCGWQTTWMRIVVQFVDQFYTCWFGFDLTQVVGLMDFALSRRFVLLILSLSWVRKINLDHFDGLGINQLLEKLTGRLSAGKTNNIQAQRENVW